MQAISQPVAAPDRQSADLSDLSDVLQFMRLLWSIVHGLQRVSKRMAREIGVTGPQRLVLRVIGLYPELAPGRLAEILHVHPSTLTGVLQRLIRQQLVARAADPNDKRRSRLRLTASGDRVNATSKGTVEAVVGQLLAHATASERSVTRRVLGLLAEQLDRRVAAAAGRAARGAGSRVKTRETRPRRQESAGARRGAARSGARRRRRTG